MQRGPRRRVRGAPPPATPSSGDATTTTAPDDARPALAALRCTRAYSAGSPRWGPHARSARARPRAQHVCSVGLAPAGGRHDRRTGRQGDDGQAAEGAAGWPKNSTSHAVLAAGVLVEREHHQVAGGQLVEDRSRPPRLGRMPKPARAKRRATSRSSHAGFTGRRTNQKRRVPADSCRARQRSPPRSCRSARSGSAHPCPAERGDQRVEVLDPDHRAPPLHRHPREAQELPEQPAHVRVVGLRQRLDLGGRRRVANTRRRFSRMTLRRNGSRRYSTRPRSGASAAIGCASATAVADVRSCDSDTLMS